MRQGFASAHPISSAASIDAGLKAHMVSVYREMATALGISGLVAGILGRDLLILKEQANGVDLATGLAQSQTLLPQSLLAMLYTPPMSYVVMFAPLVFLLFLGGKMYSMSPSAARTTLYAFAGIMGISLASIFVIYTGMSIAQAFLGTAAGMAALGAYGHTTKRDLSGMGSFLFMGVIALVITSIVNIFLGSAPLAFAVSALAVLVFSGLIVYDAQRLKNEYVSLHRVMPENQLSSMATAGALSMYLNFINIMISLLNIFGERR